MVLDTRGWEPHSRIVVICYSHEQASRVAELLNKEMKPPQLQEEEKIYYIAKDGRGSAFMTRKEEGASYGPFTRSEAQKRLDKMGIG